MDTSHRPRGASPAEQVRAKRDAFLGRLFDQLREDAIDETTADVGEALAYMAGPRGDATAIASLVADAANWSLQFSGTTPERVIRRLIAIATGKLMTTSIVPVAAKASIVAHSRWAP